MRWRVLSLRLQLILLTTLVLIVSLAVGGVLAYSYARGKVRTEMRAAIAVGGRMARNAIDDVGLAADPDRQLRRLVADFDGDRHLRASWIDPSGAIVASSKPGRASDPAPEWLNRLLSGRASVVRLALPPALGDRGSIQIEADPRNEIAEAWDELGLTLTILGIFCGLVLGLTSIALGYALRPLKHLSGAFARVGEGDYGQRVAERGPLELTRLCRGFNTMLDRLSSVEAQNRRLQEQLAAVQEEERADLARDLHDEVGPLLFAVGVDAAMIKRLADRAAQGDIAVRSDAIREATEQMQRHIRAMLGRLRPGVLLDVGLRQAVDNLVTFWRARQPNITFAVNLPAEPIGRSIEETAYRVIREGLSNAIRHGRPGRVEIDVAQDGGDMVVRVGDDGHGLEADGHRPGHGLAGMDERIRALGGTLAVRDGTGGGVTITARLPRDRSAPEAGGQPSPLAVPA
jgi:two-component system, NarL family, sensor histidine kinase UhpB